MTRARGGDDDDYAKRKQAEAGEAAAMRDERWEAAQARAGEMGVTVERKIKCMCDEFINWQ